MGLVALAALSLASNPAWAVYTIQQGDTIEIAVAGLPELRHRSTVQPDGAIAFALFDALKVEGLTPAELRLEVQKQLAGKIYRLHSNDGREVLTVIQSEEVSAEIVGYRPIYVTGNVAKPGEQTFLPQMTVRQAVALAGGPDQQQRRMARYGRDPIAVKSEYEVSRIEYAQWIARVARLTAELNGQTDLGPIELSGFGLARERSAEILQSERDVLKARMATYQREGDFLKSAVTEAAERIEVVEKQRIQEEEGSRADTVELHRMIDLLSRGQEISPRVTEARRALLLSSTRALQVNVELLELKRQQAESVRNVQHYEDDRRIALLKELQDATAARTLAAVKSRALQSELGALARGASADSLAEPMRLTFALVRRTEKDSIKSEVGDDFVLMPGDVVEVNATAPANAADAAPSD